MGNAASQVDDTRIKKEVKDDPLVVYTKHQCSFCTRAKTLLEQEKVPFRERNLDDEKQANPEAFKQYVNGLVYTTRQTSVPQIFICGKFVGGFTELSKLRDAGKLFEALAECTGENSLKE